MDQRRGILAKNPLEEALFAAALCAGKGLAGAWDLRVEFLLCAPGGGALKAAQKAG